jgi:hypothetical protein
MLISQHYAFDIARLKMDDQLRAADHHRLMAEIHQERDNHRLIAIRRQLGGLMVRAGERLQAVPSADASALRTAR